MKEQILQLRSEGKSYGQIEKILGCSRGTISYHCGKGQKEKYAKRRRKNRSKEHPYKAKIERFHLCRVQAVTKTTYSSKLRKRLTDKIGDFHRTHKDMEYTPTTFTVEDVIAKFGENPTCYLTGEPIDITKTNSYQFDHIIPRSRGGDNSLDNLGLCTKAANQAKNDMTYDEFVHFCQRIVKQAENAEVESARHECPPD